MHQFQQLMVHMMSASASQPARGAAADAMMSASAAPVAPPGAASAPDGTSAPPQPAAAVALSGGFSARAADLAAARATRALSATAGAALAPAALAEAHAAEVAGAAPVAADEVNEAGATLGGAAALGGEAGLGASASSRHSSSTWYSDLLSQPWRPSAPPPLHDTDEGVELGQVELLDESLPRLDGTSAPPGDGPVITGPGPADHAEAARPATMVCGDGAASPSRPASMPPAVAPPSPLPAAVVRGLSSSSTSPARQIAAAAAIAREFHADGGDEIDVSNGEPVTPRSRLQRRSKSDVGPASFKRPADHGQAPQRGGLLGVMRKGLRSIFRGPKNGRPRLPSPKGLRGRVPSPRRR